MTTLETVPNEAPPEGHVRLVIDGATVDAPKGELLIRACERLGIVVPRFCDHPLLDPAGACRQCLVEVEMGGRPMPKPQASCTMTVADGMVVKTQHSSPVAAKAQAGVMELLLINHPLDCPICDKGGECPLQNQAMTSGRAESRFVETKRTFPKPLAISTQVLLDRERCVLCQRCTRFSAQIAGDEFIELLERGAHQQVGVAADQPFQSYFSGNTIQICPVGALTSAAYRFRSRPFDLVSTVGVCEHCASGCGQRTDARRGAVARRLAAPEPEVNEEWSCDKGRFAFRYLDDDARITRPQVRGEDGELHEASWTDALRAAADGLLAARETGVGVLAGGRLTTADAYAYGKLARVALGSNDVDSRARAHGDEELAFLAAHVVGATPGTGGVTYADLETAPGVVCVGLEPEEESPIVFLRLRKAARAGVVVRHVAAWASPAVVRTGDRLVAAVPGDEPSVVAGLALEAGAVVLVGERAAEVPGLLSAVSALVAGTERARVAWVPRRAGERGALAAGALPTLLPGGRAVTDGAARAELEQAWGLEPGALPAAEGRDTAGMLAAAARGELAGLVVGGVEVHDLSDPDTARRGLDRAFVVSLELRRSEVTERADVVLPVAADAEREGSYLDWEGRERPFRATLDGTAALPDCRVLDTLAVEMDVDLFTQTPAAAAGELARLGVVRSTATAPTVPAAPAPTPGRGEVVLATWRRLLDHGALQAGELALAGTARDRSARVHPATATRLGVADGELVAVATAEGACTTVLRTDEGVVVDVLWLPAGPDTTGALVAGHGALVTVTGAGAPA